MHASSFYYVAWRYYTTPPIMFPMLFGDQFLCKSKASHEPNLLANITQNSENIGEMCKMEKWNILNIVAICHQNSLSPSPLRVFYHSTSRQLQTKKGLDHHIIKTIISVLPVPIAHQSLYNIPQRQVTATGLMLT